MKFPLLSDTEVRSIGINLYISSFIFFMFFDDMLLLRVNEDEEFAPIKDFTGIYNPDTAKEKYEKYWNNKKD